MTFDHKGSTYTLVKMLRDENHTLKTKLLNITREVRRLNDAVAILNNQAHVIQKTIYPDLFEHLTESENRSNIELSET